MAPVASFLSRALAPLWASLSPGSYCFGEQERMKSRTACLIFPIVPLSNL